MTLAATTAATAATAAAINASAMASSSLLVYSFTAGYYHDSIPAAKDFIGSLPYSTTFSEDPGTFEDFEYLSSFAAILFLHNTDEILTSAQQKLNLASYLRNGGGLIGVHSASAALFDDPWYGQAFGAFFNYHPYFQNATFVVEDDHEHPSTRHLPDQWNFMEEVYNFESDPRDNNVTLLLSVDQNSYQDPDDWDKTATTALQGSPHPIAWYREGTDVTGTVDGSGSGSASASSSTSSSTDIPSTDDTVPATASLPPAASRPVSITPDSASVVATSTRPHLSHSSAITRRQALSFPPSSPDTLTAPMVMPGRMWYSSLGHSIDIWYDPLFRSHIKGGIDWVLHLNTTDVHDPSQSGAGLRNATTDGQPGMSGGKNGLSGSDLVNGAASKRVVGWSTNTPSLPTMAGSITLLLLPLILVPLYANTV